MKSYFYQNKLKRLNRLKRPDKPEVGKVFL